MLVQVLMSTISKSEPVKNKKEAITLNRNRKELRSPRRKVMLYSEEILMVFS